MSSINEFITSINDFLWGVPLVLAVLFCGILLTIRLRLIQVHKLGKALKFIVKSESDGNGEISSFAALCTALSATVGTGNIIGVATAIGTGGPGALLWMEIAAFFGMATKYAEGLLSVKYRVKDQNDNYIGGPFYYIENGLGSKWKWLAKMFAVFGLLAGMLGIGTITQINGITSAANNFFDHDALYTISLFGSDYTLTTVITGVLVTIMVALIVIGGIKRIAKISEIIVPAMIFLYVTSCLVIIFGHATEIPAAFSTIVKSAFGFRQAAGGFAGFAVVKACMSKGVERGIFSNEAGLGSAPIAAAAAKTNEPARQGLVTMTGTFIDTIIVSTMSGFAIVMAGSYNKGLEGVDMTIDAFGYGLPVSEKMAAFIVMICLSIFAFTTILGWNYYSECCLNYLTGSNKRVSMVYHWLYVAAVFIGPYLTIEAVWSIAGVFNGLMAFPNIIAIIALSGVVTAETKSYLQRMKEGKVES